MRIFDRAQGTQEWFECRAGVITASMFSEIRKRLKSGANKGDYSEKAKAYAFKLAVERIGGTVLDAEGFSGWQAERGNRLEEECRQRHEAEIGMLSDLSGFVTTDCGRFGCSADALIGDNGGGEYKAFLAPQKLRSIIVDDDWGDVMDQAQGCMMVTERQWWDLALYCPPLATIGKDFMLKRTERDDDYIEGLKADLEAFDALVEHYRAEIIGTQAEPEQAMQDPVPAEQPAIIF